MGGVIENVPSLQPSREYKLYLRTNAIYDGCSVTALSSKLVTFTYYLKPKVLLRIFPFASVDFGPLFVFCIEFGVA